MLAWCYVRGDQIVEAIGRLVVLESLNLDLSAGVEQLADFAGERVELDRRGVRLAGVEQEIQHHPLARLHRLVLAAEKGLLGNEHVGVGFDMRYAHKLLGFPAPARAEDYDATSVGLAVVQRIIQPHGGVWAETSRASI